MEKRFRAIIGMWVLALVFCLALAPVQVQAEAKININTAPAEILQSLPGIGPAYAERIIEFRNETPFEAIEDITKVSGIGEATFEKIKDLITVE